VDLLKPPPLVDHRGRAHPVAWRRDESDREVRHAIRRGVARRTRRVFWTTVVASLAGCSGLMVALIVVALLLHVSREQIRPASGALWLVLYVGMFVVFQLRVSPKIRQAQVVEGLERGVCPVCLSALGAAQPAPDGCSVCPKCGAAWRRP
jgi:hypothetical protein